jgi:thiol-disulfide isomerase/thioredoxin
MKKTIFTLSMALALSTAANAQVKKVILEDFTGTWCGWCPEGTVVIEGLKTANPTKFIGVASHNGDGLQVPDGAAIDAGLNVTSYPNGAIDRFQFPGTTKIPMGRGSWASSVNTRLSGNALCSVSFSDLKKAGATYQGKVNVKFTSASDGTTPIAIQIYVLEDSIPATGSLAQGNYSSSVQGGADPLVNWYHNETLRDGLFGVWGDATVIPVSPVVSTTYSKDFSFTPNTAWNVNQLRLVAFVSYDGTVAANKKEILNADYMPIKSIFPLSINNNNFDLKTSVYPNPANNSENIHFTFDLNSDATVNFQIMNSLGQVISKPYESKEIAGVHSIQWNTNETGTTLAPGIYFAKITADNGQTGTYKFVIN